MAANSEREREAKFLVIDLAQISRRILAAGGSRSGERVFESNLRFDTPDRRLSSAGEALRLRQDRAIRMTWKGPADRSSEANDRREIEFTVSDLAAAQHLLEALGFEVFSIYEKYRTTYHLDGLEIVLDELPFGNFVEIEGTDDRSIHAVADKLHLNWQHRCAASYLELFTRLVSKGCGAMRLTFADFEHHTIAPQDLDLLPAD